MLSNLIYPTIFASIIALMVLCFSVNETNEQPCRHVEIRQQINKIKGYNVTVCLTQESLYRDGEHIKNRYSDEYFK